MIGSEPPYSNRVNILDVTSIPSMQQHMRWGWRYDSLSTEGRGFVVCDGGISDIDVCGTGVCSGVCSGVCAAAVAYVAVEVYAAVYACAPEYVPRR